MFPIETHPPTIEGMDPEACKLAKEVLIFGVYGLVSHESGGNRVVTQANRYGGGIKDGRVTPVNYSDESKVLFQSVLGSLNGGQSWADLQETQTYRKFNAKNLHDAAWEKGGESFISSEAVVSAWDGTEYRVRSSISGVNDCQMRVNIESRKPLGRWSSAT